jgi:hypothetical protein
MPRLVRDTMMPSETPMISSKLRIASVQSIWAIILVLGAP